jgi:hypothetical protein
LIHQCVTAGAEGHGPFLKPMKKLNVCLLAFSAGQVLHAGTVIADFNDLAPGDLNGKTGGTGFAASTWINNSAGTAETFIDVVTGNLTAPAATNYSLPQSGAAQSAQNTNGTTSLQTRALATPLTGDTVWFSFLLNQPTASPGVTTGSRGGICLNQATTFHDPNNPRIMGLGSQLTAWLTGNNDVVVNSAFTAGTTAVVLGRILVSDTGNETLSLWVNPNVNALGTPTATHSGANWIGPTGITSVSVQSYAGHRLDDSRSGSGGRSGIVCSELCLWRRLPGHCHADGDLPQRGT